MLLVMMFPFIALLLSVFYFLFLSLLLALLLRLLLRLLLPTCRVAGAQVASVPTRGCRRRGTPVSAQGR